MGVRHSAKLVILLAAISMACSWSGDADRLPRALLIGLDGADLRVADRLIERGRVPALAGLVQRGVAGPLETVHNWSPVIWTSIATGVQPDKHGIDGFQEAGGRPAGSLGRMRPAFWNILSSHAQSVGVLAWWVTFPAERVDGYVVSPYMGFLPAEWRRGRANVRLEWSDSDPRRTFPPELQSALRSRMLTPSDLDPSERAGLEGPGTANTPWVLARDKSYYEAALLLLRLRPVETLAIYFQGIDVASHDFSFHVFGRRSNRARSARVSEHEQAQAMNRVDVMYEAVDRWVGGLLERVPPDADVIVVSDHGWEYDGTDHFNRNPGLFIAAGPSFRSGARVHGVSVLDVLPMLLAARGVPLSRDFDGAIPEGVMHPAVVEGAEWVDDYGIEPVALGAEAAGPAADDERMLELLHELGYLEDEAKKGGRAP